MAHSHLPADSAFAQDYRVVRLLREGDASTVYVATQLSTGLLRALEVFHPPSPLDGAQRARFLADTARAASLFESPSVAQVLAAGVEEGEPWLATELTEGELLAARIERVGVLERRAAVTLLTQVGRALAAAHQVGVVHGHLTPQRILIPTRRQSGGEPYEAKVLGFGSARLTFSWADVSSVGVSIEWLSPDQISGRPRLDPSADVWAFGLLTFLVLTGRRYWSAVSPLDLAKEALVEPLAPASVRAHELDVAALWPAELDAWFARCVSRDSRTRFHDAGAATVELLGLLRPDPGEPFSSPGMGGSYDEGLEGAGEEGASSDDVNRGEGPYRRGVRPPEVKPVRVEPPERMIMGNPKGSFYDRGHNTFPHLVHDQGDSETPRKGRRLAAILLLALVVIAAAGLLIFRR